MSKGVFSGMFESSNISRDNVSREIGRKGVSRTRLARDMKEAKGSGQHVWSRRHGKWAGQERFNNGR